MKSMKDFINEATDANKKIAEILFSDLLRGALKPPVQNVKNYVAQTAKDLGLNKYDYNIVINIIRSKGYKGPLE